MRPGAMSSSDARASRASHSSRATARLRGLRMAWMPESRRHGSARGGFASVCSTASNSCAARSALPVSASRSTR